MRGWRGDISGKISEFAYLHVCGMSWPIGRLKLPKAGKYDYIREYEQNLLGNYMCWSGLIHLQDLGQGKEEKLRLRARVVWKSAVRFDKEEWPSRGGKGEKSNQQVGCV